MDLFTQSMHGGIFYSPEGSHITNQMMRPLPDNILKLYEKIFISKKKVNASLVEIE
jgi:hypothetical protein